MVSLSERSSWTEVQKQQVFDSFYNFDTMMKRVNHPLSKHVCIPIGYDNLCKGNVQSVIVEDKYLLIYTIGPQWYTDRNLLFEEMILSLGNGLGNPRVVIQAMEQIAKANECAGIVTGNATGRSGFTRMYEGSGFIPISTQFYKEI